MANRVADSLRDAGHRIFLDADRADGLVPGEDWERALFRELRLCDAVVYLNSPAAQASKWCHSELVLAAELGKRVYSVDLSPGVVPHVLLRSVQGIRLDSDIEISIQRLSNSLSLDPLGGSIRFAWNRGRPPYPGMVAMDVADAGVFFGREEEIRGLMARVDGPLGRSDGDLLLVLGSSGAGKSSLVRAGLVAHLAVRGSGWVVAGPFEPGLRPVDRLVSRLVAIVPGQLTEDECRDRLLGEGLALFGEWLVDRVGGQARRLLVTVDQAEQLVTVTSAEECQNFTSVLATGLRPGSPVTVVMTARSDRLDQIQRLPAIGSMIRAPFVITPVSRSQLAAVIEGPARRADLAFAPGLVGRLIEDAIAGAGGEAVDALPFLAFTLREMYDLVAENGRTIFTEDDYERVGRIEGAITRRTEAAESSLPPDSGLILDRLLPRLVALSDDYPPTGRPLSRERIVDEEQPIVAMLEDQRLITGTSDTVKLAHERLISAWPRLARVVAERRDDLLFDARLERQAQDWEHGHGELPGREATAAASSWLAHRADPDVGGSVVGDYVRAAQQALRRQRARKVSALFLVVALAIGASAVAVVAVRTSSAEATESRIAQSEAMAAEATSLLPTNAPLAMLLSLQAYETAYTLQSASAVFQASEQPVRDILRTAGSPVDSVAFSPGGETLAVGDSRGRVGLWDVMSGRRTATLDEGGQVLSVAFSPNGQTLAAADYRGYVRLWNVASGGLVATLDEGRPVSSIAFSPDGRMLGAADYSGKIGLWDVASGRRTATLVEGGEALSVVFSPDGKTLAAGDYSGKAALWDVASRRRVATLNEGRPVSGVAFSPEGKTLALGDYSGQVGLWDMATDRQVTTLDEGGQVDTLMFSPDGKILAVGDYSGRVGMWDVASLRRAATLAEGGQVDSVAFSPDGKTLAVGDYNGQVGLWDVASGRQPATFDEGHPVSSMAFSPRGKILGVGDYSGRVGLWDVASGRRTATLNERSSVYSVAFSPDGKILAVGDLNGYVGLWNLASGRRALTLDEGRPASSIAFSPDGRFLAIGDLGGHVGLWDVVSGRRVATLDQGSPVYAVAFSPTRKVLAAGDYSGRVGLWDVVSGRRAVTLDGGSPVSSIAFSPDGRTLVMGDNAGDVSIWNAVTGQLFIIPWQGGSGSPVTSVAFSPSGTLAGADVRGDVALVRRSLSDLDQHYFRHLICDEVRGNMTPSEWAQYARGQPYHKACPNYP
jgi:WD40 repeat protein